MSDLDPRYEWDTVEDARGLQVRHVRGRCLHADVVPVESGGEVVARLCLTCDAQLPA